MRRPDPHLVLAASVAIVLAAEAGYSTWTSDLWIALEAGAALAGLAYAWREQHRLRLLPLLALALVFHSGWVGLHLGLDVEGDVDSSRVFRRQGDALLEGDYPRSEYPVGAVLLFAFESLVSGGATRTANAILMIPFQLGTVAGIWALRTRWSPWLAALVALWPMNAFYWEFKFDVVPTALLVLGLLFAYRERFVLSGLVLGLGAAVKWTPGLAFLALAVWLVASGRLRAARNQAIAFAAAVALVYVPFLVWSADDVLAAYTRQGGRSITPESIWYLPLHLAGLAKVRTHISFSAGAPGWADALAVVVQVLLVLAALGLAYRVRGSLPAGVAVAAVTPVAFLITNRIFSPQFLVTMAAAWAVAAALLARSAREQAAIGIALAGATFANAFVYPFALPHYDVTWRLCSAALFVLGLAATAWVALRALNAVPARPSVSSSSGRRSPREALS